jgi:hypothetical protein
MSAVKDAPKRETTRSASAVTASFTGRRAGMMCGSHRRRKLTALPSFASAQNLTRRAGMMCGSHRRSKLTTLPSFASAQNLTFGTHRLGLESTLFGHLARRATGRKARRRFKRDLKYHGQESGPLEMAGASSPIVIFPSRPDNAPQAQPESWVIGFLSCSGMRRARRMQQGWRCGVAHSVHPARRMLSGIRSL